MLVDADETNKRFSSIERVGAVGTAVKFQKEKIVSTDQMQNAALHIHTLDSYK
jgi:hypothetical protein